MNKGHSTCNKISGFSVVRNMCQLFFCSKKCLMVKPTASSMESFYLFLPRWCPVEAFPTCYSQAWSCTQPDGSPTSPSTERQAVLLWFRFGVRASFFLSALLSHFPNMYWSTMVSHVELACYQGEEGVWQCFSGMKQGVNKAAPLVDGVCFVCFPSSTHSRKFLSLFGRKIFPSMKILHSLSILSLAFTLSPFPNVAWCMMLFQYYLNTADGVIWEKEVNWRETKTIIIADLNFAWKMYDSLPPL